MSFTLLLPSLWAGLRLDPLLAALHGLVSGIVVVVLTLGGWGMYSRVADAPTQAFVAQTFLLVMFSATVVLALVRHQFERAQHRSRARTEVLDSVLASVGDGIVLVDERDRVLLTNAAATRMLGVAGGGQFVTPPHLDLFDEHGAHVAGPLPFETLVSDEQGRDFVLRDRSNGEERTVHLEGRPVADRGAARLRVLVTVRDVTAERVEQRTLASFAGVVAHDLKNPLAVVEGWSEMLESQLEAAVPLEPAQGLSIVRRISAAAGQMRTLINELLTYTLARDQDLRTVPVLLGEVASLVAQQHSGASDAARTAHVGVACPHTVCGDPLLLRQLLDNLVGNAVKYVAPDVEPRVSISSARTPDGRIEVSVTDNGLGVPPEERERIFDSFYRLDRPGYAGTGLGLSICQRIVERHGGRLQVSDGPDGVGSRFSFTLTEQPQDE